MRLWILPVLWLIAILAACNSDEEASPPTSTSAPALLSTIPGGGWRAVGVGVNPVNQRVYVVWSMGQDRLRLAAINSSTGAQIAETWLPQGEFFNQIESNPVTGMVYAVDALSNTLYILDGDTNELLVRTQGRRGTGQAVAIDATTNLVYWTDFDITVIDGTSGEIDHTISFEGNPQIIDLAINPNTHLMYASSWNDKVFVINLDDGTRVASIDVSGPASIAINPVTNRIFVSSHSTPEVTVIDGSTSTVSATIPLAGPSPAESPLYLTAPDIGIDSRANRIYLTIDDNGTVDVVDGATNTIVQSIAVGGEPTNIAVDETTGRAYVIDSTFGPGASGVFVIGRPDGSTLSSSPSATATPSPY